MLIDSHAPLHNRGVFFILRLVSFRKPVTNVKNWAFPRQIAELPGTSCRGGWAPRAPPP